MRKFQITFVISVLSILFGQAQQCDLQLKAYDANGFNIITARIIDVTATATNKLKDGTLNYEYLAIYGNEEFRIEPLRDVDMDDNSYPDLEVGKTYILVVSEIPSVKQRRESSGCMNQMEPLNDMAKKLFELKSLRAYNLNFGKIVPFDKILSLDIPDNTPLEIKSHWDKWVKKNSPDGNTEKLKNTKQLPESLTDRISFDITSKAEYHLHL